MADETTNTASSAQNVAPLVSCMASLFNSKLYSDLEVRCNNGDSYAAHKFVLCAQSQVFAKACDPELKFKEAQEGVIHLKNDDPTIVKALLEYLYRFGYSAPEGADAEPLMLFHVHVYAIAEVYGVNGLKSLAVQRFKKVAQEGWKDSIFGTAVKAIYESTVDSDKGLRDIAIDIAKNNFGELIKNKKFEDMMVEVGSFSKDLAKGLYNEAGETPLSFRCSICHRMLTQNRTYSGTGVYCVHCGCTRYP